MYYKIILLGEIRVGKTTLRRSYMGENLDNSYAKTIGVDFALKRTPKGGFQIWDLAGESSPNTLRSHLQGTSGVLLIFDVMNPRSLERLKELVSIVTDALGNELIISVVGNKIDLRTETDGLTQENAEMFLEGLRQQNTGEVSYFETAALLGTGVEEAFSWLLDKLTERSRDD